MAATNWQAEILAGVELIPNTGAVPGILVTKNPDAKSILPVKAPWFVASEYGSGRVMVLAHEAYLSEFFTSDHKNQRIAQLNFNMKKWLTKGKNPSDIDVGKLGSVTKETIRHFDILLWDGSDDVRNVSSTDLLDFVRNGGSVVHAVCSWGWLQLRPGKTFNDMPFKAFLDEIGVSHQNAGNYLPDGGIDVRHLVPNDFAFQRYTEAEVPLPSFTQDRDQTAKRWRSEILAGVVKIPHTGAIPGSILVFGDQARPILSGQKNLDVLLAAAELGEGRMAAMAHESFLHNFTKTHENESIKKLHNNLKTWLTKGKFRSNDEIVYCQGKKKNLNPAEVSILLWTGDRNPSYSSDEVLNFVLSGGSLIHACCPWGWLQVNSGKSFDDMPFADILDIVGMDYTEKYCGIPSEGLDVCGCASNDSCHLGIVVDALRDDHRQMSNVSETVALLSEMTESKLKLISNKLDGLVQLVESPKIDFEPSESCPVKESKCRAMMGLREVLHKTGKMKTKMPGIHKFPGDFERCPQHMAVQLEIHSHLHDVHPTGYYAKADEDIMITVLNQEAIQSGWRLQIGAHSDCLSGCDSLKRWPKVVCSVNIKQEFTTLKSHFGGLVYLISPKGRRDLRLQLDNVVEAPLFDVLSPATVSDWTRRRNAEGLWADICGEFIIITLPSSSIRDLENPLEIMQTWDRVVRAHFHLRGSDIRKHRRQWLVTDVQPSVGYMHSGYPVVTHLDVAKPGQDSFLLNNESLCGKGSWGVFHEFGHNMQRNVWTFAGTGEVTVNIFTLHAMQVIPGLQPWIHTWLRDQLPATRTYLTSNQDYTTWKSNPGIALFIYAQIAHNFSWSVYKEVFRKYEQMDSRLYPNQEQDQIDLWYQMLSEVCGHSLAPLVDYWKIPLSPGARDRISQYPPFLPRDEITQMNPSREAEILQKYTDCLREPNHILPDRYDTTIGPPVIPQPRMNSTVIQCS